MILLKWTNPCKMWASIGSAFFHNLSWQAHVTLITNYYQYLNPVLQYLKVLTNRWFKFKLGWCLAGKPSGSMGRGFSKGWSMGSYPRWPCSYSWYLSLSMGWAGLWAVSIGLDMTLEQGRCEETDGEDRLSGSPLSIKQ